MFVKKYIIDDYHVETWFERDRAYVALMSKTREKPILEFWDEAVASAIEDGFINSRDYLGSLYKYAQHLGLITI